MKRLTKSGNSVRNLRTVTPPADLLALAASPSDRRGLDSASRVRLVRRETAFGSCRDGPEFRLTSNVVVLVVREITFAKDFDGLPLGLAAHTEPMSGCGTRPMGVRIS